MRTYEFNSVVEDNGIIRIPEQYLHGISSPVKVIVLADDDVRDSGKRKHFSAMKIRTKGFTFNRDEANER
ncbi:MAG: hypothetical protein LBD07_03065 [Spirochaetaceae bacterium]|jgi:hypothetical protein|nr:hypothetical protein [Spirochaetaceae bacterium]